MTCLAPVSPLVLTFAVLPHHDATERRFKPTSEAAATHSKRSSDESFARKAGDEVDVWRWSGLNEMFFRALKSTGMSGGAWLLSALPCQAARDFVVNAIGEPIASYVCHSDASTNCVAMIVNPRDRRCRSAGSVCSRWRRGSRECWVGVDTGCGWAIGNYCPMRDIR